MIGVKGTAVSTDHDCDRFCEGCYVERRFHLVSMDDCEKYLLLEYGTAGSGDAPFPPTNEAISLGPLIRAIDQG